MNIFYHISKDKYLISDLELCKASPSSFDVKLWEIANNEELCNYLGFIYLLDWHYTYKTKGKCFCHYLAAFYDDKFHDAIIAKGLTNPTVRLLCVNETLLEKVKENHEKLNYETKALVRPPVFDRIL